MTKKIIRGLLDLVDLEEGEDWEFEKPSESYIPGMGFGATPDAIRWAYKGYQLELNQTIESVLRPTKTKRGRPSISDNLKKPQMRAFVMWAELRAYPKSFRAHHTNRELIEWMRSRKDLSPGATKLWSGHSNLERSLSEGRSYWEIDDKWESVKCEIYWRRLLND